MKDFDIKKLKREFYFEENLAGLDMKFWAEAGLFSPRKVDEGSKMLINKMKIEPADHILDLGCGYGVLGLTAAKIATQGRVDMVDKDFVAIEYANRNIMENKIDNAAAYLSNMFDQIDQEKSFDVILSNIPAKVSREMYWLMFFNAAEKLNTGGRIYLVAIAHLSAFLKNNLKQFFGNYKKIDHNRRYVVYQAEKK